MIALLAALGHRSPAFSRDFHAAKGGRQAFNAFFIAEDEHSF
jgi:hypothetical protein